MSTEWETEVSLWTGKSTEFSPQRLPMLIERRWRNRGTTGIVLTHLDWISRYLPPPYFGDHIPHADLLHVFCFFHRVDNPHGNPGIFQLFPPPERA
jgi:hypothetical protein